MRIIRSRDKNFQEELSLIKKRGRLIDPEIFNVVREIVASVENRGDEALFEYARKYDDTDLSAVCVEISEEEKKKAMASVDDGALDVLQTAAERIRAYHLKQVSHSWFDRDDEGSELGQIVRPLERIGIYAPGGLAPYPSTVLMASIPATIAGVREIVLATPAKKGFVHPLMIAAASMGGVHRILKIGGAQAVAALAFGTESVPRVDKIVGPGNIYVALAKKIVFGDVGIDMVAGPSEVVVVSDGKGNPAHVAADLLSQAEHDSMASAVLIVTEEGFALEVAAEIKRQLPLLSRSSVASRSIEQYGAIIITGNLGEAAEIANIFAPEHLELAVEDPRALLVQIKNAGTVFLGYHTPEAVGDYLAGSNHILPTGGTARFSSPLGVYDFVKRMSVVSFSRKSLDLYGSKIAAFAGLEGLDAHARSVTLRLKEDDKV